MIAFTSHILFCCNVFVFVLQKNTKHNVNYGTEKKPWVTSKSEQLGVIDFCWDVMEFINFPLDFQDLH